MTTSQPRRRSRSISNFGSHIWVNNDRLFFSFYGHFKLPLIFSHGSFKQKLPAVTPGQLYPRNCSLEIMLQFPSVWVQTLQDGRTLYSKQSYVFFFDFNGFWRENDVTWLTPKLKVQLDREEKIVIFKELDGVETNVNFFSERFNCFWRYIILKFAYVSKNSNKMAEN